MISKLLGVLWNGDRFAEAILIMMMMHAVRSHLNFTFSFLFDIFGIPIHQKLGKFLPPFLPSFLPSFLVIDCIFSFFLSLYYNIRRLPYLTGKCFPT
ncbi:hypothetical protein LguiB_020294 [Lonicera macranthoides]